MYTHPKKSLGQHFLTCGWVVNALLRAARISEQDTVVEIGPGTGVLTRALARSAKRVIAIEKDERLAADLVQMLAQENIHNVEIITGDVLTSFPRVAATHALGPASYKLVSNIPYYLTSRLLRLALEHWPRPECMALTTQKEVAERICAEPPDMNILALSVQAFGTPRAVRTVPASCFSPAPRVDSAILSISDISDAYFVRNALEPAVFFTTIRAAFGKKRKVLANSLRDIADRLTVTDALAAIARPPATRAEEIPLEGWVTICSRIQKSA